MDRFPCHGTLQITVDDDDLGSPLRLKVKHHEAHLHYVDINISKKIKDLVESLRNEPATNASSFNSYFLPAIKFSVVLDLGPSLARKSSYRDHPETDLCSLERLEPRRMEA